MYSCKNESKNGIVSIKSEEDTPVEPAVAASSTKQDQKKKWRFRIVGYAVTAARRFRAALNPKIDFRKRNLITDIPFGATLTEMSATELRRTKTYDRRSLEGMYTRTASGHIVNLQRPISRGSRGYYIMKPLPPVDVRS